MSYEGDRKRRYQLDWIKARRDQWIAENGPCRLCGGSDDLQVDHVIPRRTAGGLAPTQIWSRRIETRERELASCQVLCCRCHNEKTKDEIKVSVHGLTLYRNGCRCEECKIAKRDQMRRLRATR